MKVDHNPSKTLIFIVWCVCREQEGLDEERVWDSNKKIERRKVIFNEEDDDEEDDDFSGSSDGEDDDQADEDENEDDLVTFLQDVGAECKGVGVGSGPPKKIQKLDKGQREVITEAPAFADSEDELENNKEDDETWKADYSGHYSSKEDEESEEESVKEDRTAKEKLKNQTEEESEEEEEHGKYRVYTVHVFFQQFISSRSFLVYH